MLEQQFYSDPKVANYIHKNFIPFRAAQGDKFYRPLRNKYQIRGLPKEAIIGPDGKLVDKLGDYGSKEIFLERIKKSIKGAGTLSSLEKRYDNNPEDLLSAFKLALKYNNIYKRDKSKAVLKDILKKKNRLKSLSIKSDDGTISTNCYEYAKYLLGVADIRSRDEANPQIMMEFIKEFPDSRFKDDAYFTFMRYSARNGKHLESAEKYADYYVKHKPEVSYIMKDAADVFLKMGKEKKALDVYGGRYYKKYIAGLEDDEDRAGAQNSYAWFWAERAKNLKNALEASKNSLEILPEAHGYWDTLSMIFWKMKNYKEALKAEETALSFSPESQGYKNQIKAIKADMEKNK